MANQYACLLVDPDTKGYTYQDDGITIQERDPTPVEQSIPGARPPSLTIPPAVGPFDTEQEAREFARENNPANRTLGRANWLVIELTAPENVPSRLEEVLRDA